MVEMHTNRETNEKEARQAVEGYKKEFDGLVAQWDKGLLTAEDYSRMLFLLLYKVLYGVG